MKQLYITMPQPGETITEGTLVKWLIKSGDAVLENTPLAELETEKAIFEYESPFEGKIIQILHPDQSRLPVATPLAIIEVSDALAKQYLMLGIAEEVTTSDKPAASIQSPVLIKTEEASAAKADSTKTLSLEILLSPYVRRLALEHGVSNETLKNLAQKNPQGRVTKEAIEEVLSGKPSASLSPKNQDSPKVQTEVNYSVMPFSPIRMRIAENMQKSKQTIPHAHTGLTVDMSEVLKYREAHKEIFLKKTGVSLSLLTLLQPILTKAIMAYPQVNASFVEGPKGAEIRLFNDINLSVAVGTEMGLITPVIKKAQTLSSVEFAKLMNDVVSRASQKKLKPADLTGATFLFNNFGFFGLNFGVQIIQYPLASVLGMGALEKKVVPSGQTFKTTDVANFFLAFDHRVIDGLEAGKFLNLIKKGIEEFNAESHFSY